MKQRLLDVERKERWTGSRELVPVPRDACPSCGCDTSTTTVAQPALFRHGGYGATLASTIRRCPCGWGLEAQRQEVRPVA